MQKKTISKIVKAKMEDWLDSINDVQLKKDLKDNIIVSGGCIASLFLGEEVNDYDVYIKDRKVLLRLTQYYTKGVKDIEILDGFYLDQLFRDNEQRQGQFATALRNMTPEQIRLYMYEAGLRIERDPAGEVESLTGKKKKYLPVYFSPNAISLTDDLQIVLRFHGSVEDVHKTFDFVHATNYFTFGEGLVTNLPAMESLITRCLKYQGSHYPLTSIIRARKFIKRKWNIGSGELLKIMFQISELNLKNPDVLEEQLIGVDVSYFGALIEALRGKCASEPEFELTSTYLGELIERIFDGEE